MIDTMTIVNVLTENGDYVSIDVMADNLEWVMTEKYAELDGISDPVEYENRFFFLACQYLESCISDVKDTDEAKIEIWYPKKSTARSENESRGNINDCK